MKGEGGRKDMRPKVPKYNLILNDKDLMITR